MTFTRRSFGLTAVGAAALPALPAAAKAPLDSAQAAGIYRMKVGTLEVTVFNDGTGALPTKFFSGDPAGVGKLMDAGFVTGDAAPTSFNAWLINTGDKLVLVDTGYGSGIGPLAGHLPKSLAAAGVDPASIDAVIITHVHPDHCNGLLTPTDKKIAYPNATVHINADEYAWWMEGDVKVPEGKPFFKDLFAGGRAAFKPYIDAGKVQTFKDGAELAPGVTAVTAPGHTVGHTMLRLAPSGGGQLLIWTDIVHSTALQFPEPERSIAYDIDPPMAIATRKKVMDMAATDRLLIAGMHIGFPGVGHVARAGSGYAFVPIPWNGSL